MMSQSKSRKTYDAIVIGSGVAGMTAGTILAKEGQRVLVLEQYRNPGGLMITYHRKGNRFPTGVHCLGSLGQGQILWKYFKYMGLLDLLNLVPMEEEGFNEYRFNGEKYTIPYGQEAFRRRLIDYFPREKNAINCFVADMKDTVSYFPLYSLRVGLENPFRKNFLQSAQSYLDNITDSPELKAILSAINPFLGIPPEECPLYILFLVLDSFLNSAWRVDESHCPLTEAFRNSFEAFGGEMRCQAFAEEIQSENGEVRGVRLKRGELIEAKTVVFTGHPRQLVSLCKGKGLRPAFKNRILEAPNTPGVFGIAVKWQDSECPLALCDAFLYTSLNTNAQYSQNLINTGEDPRCVYCSSSPKSSDGAYSVVALCNMSAEEMEPWTHSCQGDRPMDYKNMKDFLAGRIFSILQKTWPQSAKKMTLVDSFTPLTFRDYTLTFSGSAYGFKKSVAKLRHTSLKAVTRIKGLVLAGQSVVIPGVLGSVISSVDACGVVLGHQYLIDRMGKETQ